MKRLFLILILSALILVGCGDDSNTEPSGPVSLVPSNANLIAHIDISTMMEEMDVEGFIDRIPKEPGDPQSLQDIYNLLGINELREAVFFGDMSNIDESGDILGGDDDYFGLIVMGSFNEDNLITTLESENKEELEISTYKGYKTHSSASENMAVTMLGPDSLMISTLKPVKDVIDVMEGNKSGIEGEVLDTFNDLGSGLAKLAMVMPEGVLDEMQEDMDEEGMMGINPFGFVEDMTTLGLVVDKQDDSMPVDIRICFTSEESAENMKGMLGFVLAMFDVDEMEVPEEEQVIMDILKGMTMELDGACLDVNMNVTSDMLDEMAENFEMGFMEGLSEGLGDGLGDGLGFGLLAEDDEDLTGME